MTTIVRTAGMVNGTPDWQLDRMYETDTAKKLEQVYADEPDYTKQIDALKAVRKTLESVVDNLLAAEDELDNTPFEDSYGVKIREMIYRVEDVDCDVGAIMNRLKEGA